MDKNELFQVLLEWNFWKNSLPTGIQRQSYLHRLRQFIDTNQVVTVMGPRRAGKSYIMRQAAEDLIKKGVPVSNILFVNFEDPRFTEASVKFLNTLWETYLEFLAPKETPYLFLDEIQEIPEWEKWVRTIHELGKAKVVVSGSNARLLSRELGTLLTGRHLDLGVAPLSFKEFLEFNGLVFKDSVDILARVIEIRGFLRKYLEFGGFPEVVLSAPKKEILLNYFEDIIHKDLLRRFRIRKTDGLKSLVKYYLSSAASHVTFTRLGKSLALSPESVEKFSGLLEQVYTIFLLKRFSFKVREQEKSPRKVYAIDTGLCNAVGFRFSENLGKLAENTVFLELKRQQILSPELELYYWKDEQHHEVDFVVKEGLKVSGLIQVCWNASDENTRDREIRGLIKAMAEFNLGEATVITEEEDGHEEVKGKILRFVPLWKWLLRGC